MFRVVTIHMMTLFTVLDTFIQNMLPRPSVSQHIMSSFFSANQELLVLYVVLLCQYTKMKAIIDKNS